MYKYLTEGIEAGLTFSHIVLLPLQHESFALRMRKKQKPYPTVRFNSYFWDLWRRNVCTENGYSCQCFFHCFAERRKQNGHKIIVFRIRMHGGGNNNNGKKFKRYNYHVILITLHFILPPSHSQGSSWRLRRIYFISV